MSQIDIGKLRVISVDKWNPDAEHPSCEICDTSFSFTRRRHHCRFCGKVVCDACSPRTLDSVRICNLCLKCNVHSFSLTQKSFGILNTVDIGGTLKIKYNDDTEDVFLLFDKIQIETGKLLYMLIYTTKRGSHFKYIFFVEKGQNFVFFSIDDYTSPAKLLFSEENRSYSSKIPKEILNDDSLLISNIIFENEAHQAILQGQTVQIGETYKMYNILDAAQILEIKVLAIENRIENRIEDENPVTKDMKKIKIKLVSISDNILPQTFTVGGEYYLLNIIANNPQKNNPIRLIISKSGLTTDTSFDNSSDLNGYLLIPPRQAGGNKHRKNKNKKSKRVIKRYISKRYKNRRNKVTKRSKRSKKLRRR